MKIQSLPIIRKSFQDSLGKTVVECDYNGSTIAVWINGDVSMNQSLICNIVVNEVNDTFVARKNSARVHPAGHAKAGQPLYLKDEVVPRLVQSYEFKSFAGNGQAAQFAQAAKVFGLQLNVVMAA